MDAKVILLPRDLRPDDLHGRSVVVFDVLRATTTMTAALAAGVREIRVLADLESARRAADRFHGPRLLCGESNCLPPPGFDLGNSPGTFNRAAHAGRVAFMSTTNGTRAILAARGAHAIFTGALVNASAVARAVAAGGRPVTLLCAGTGGEIALEDLIGAGAVLDHVISTANYRPAGDTALIARQVFACARANLRSALTEAAGGQNVVRAGLPADIDFAARLDVIEAVGVLEGAEPVVRPWSG
jgi:2-phosphosulfolactate phosphatase